MASPTRDFHQSYTGQHLNHISMPMGGMGAGMICLSGTGGLENVSWRHKPAMLDNRRIFATVSVQKPVKVARMIEGPIPDWKVFGYNGGGGGFIRNNLGLPHYREATFTNNFPFGEIDLKDDAMPLQTRVTGWSPFAPGDEDLSSHPVAGLEYTFTNPDGEKAEGVFSFHMQHPLNNEWNFGEAKKEKAPLHDIRRTEHGLIFTQPCTPGKVYQEGYCTMMILDEPRVGRDANWFRGGWFDSLSMVWKAVEDGEVKDRRPPRDDGPPSAGGSLYVPFTVEPGESKTIRVLLAWYIPYSTVQVDQGDSGCGCSDGSCAPDPGKYYRPWYTSCYRNIDTLADTWYDRYEEWRNKSALFAQTFNASDLPSVIKEAVLANLSILKSPTVLRQHDGRLWGWEGCHDQGGCCSGTCTHVWNYAQAIPHLFPNLERSLRETEFEVSQSGDGQQKFRTPLPIKVPEEFGMAACDGQLGGILKVYREWRICGDDAWLKRLWPKVTQSLEYGIRTWDPKRTGHMTEPHHNTYDIEFWGPEIMGMSFYLAALHSCICMAEYLGEETHDWPDLLEKGQAYCEDYLDTGEYFIQKIDWSESDHDPLSFKELVNQDKNKQLPEVQELLKTEGPKYQYGTGCLSDGVFGEFMAWASGMPPSLPKESILQHLQAIHRYNFKEDLSGHANPQRPGYAIGAEGGLLLCSWPHGGQLSLPFVYSNEVWTGIEYQVAAHLISFGEVEKGLDIVKACRQRYDGVRRNPFNEYECGHWYARAMSSYALIQAYTGLRYDAVEKALYMAPKAKGDFKCFISTHTGYGLAGVRNGQPFCEVVSGRIAIDRYEVIG